MTASAPSSKRTTAPVPVALVGLSTCVGAIHLAVAATHLGAGWVDAAFFGLVGGAQLAWAARAVLAGPSRTLLVAGALGNASVLGVWLLTRMAGVPVGQHAGDVMAAGLVDGIAGLLQVLLVVGAVVLVWRGLGRERTSTATSWAVVAAAVMLTATSLGALVDEDHADAHGHDATTAAHEHDHP